MNTEVCTKRINGNAAYLKAVYSDECNKVFWHIIPVIEYADNDGNTHKATLKYPIYSNSIDAKNLEQACEVVSDLDKMLYVVKKFDWYYLYIRYTRHLSAVRFWMAAKDCTNCAYIYGESEDDCICIVSVTGDKLATVSDQHSLIGLVAEIAPFKE